MILKYISPNKNKIVFLLNTPVYRNCINKNLIVFLSNMNSFNSFLETPISYLKGIGPQRAEALLKELHISMYKDLLSHYPFRYVDRTKFYDIREVTEDGASYQLRGFIENMEVVGDKRSKRLVVKFRDRTGVIELVWFQGHK